MILDVGPDCFSAAEFLVGPRNCALYVDAEVNPLILFSILGAARGKEKDQLINLISKPRQNNRSRACEPNPKKLRKH
jgi:hypothetical protein